VTGAYRDVGDLRLWVEDDGDPGAPAVLLLNGSDATVLRWPAALITTLVDAGYRVVRFDTRDCGLSTKIDPDDPYRLEDLAADALGVLDAVGVDRAHVVGYSMGGAVAQVLALDHPDRVRTLTLIAATPGAGDDRLPDPEEWFVHRMAERLFEPPPRDADGRAAWVVDLYRLLAGDRYPFDETTQRTLAEAEVARSWYPESGHGIAVNASPSRLDRLGTISAPTLVVHGTRDPVYAIEHGEALAAAIPAAQLVRVEGLGHEVPAAFAPELADRLLALFAQG
jgi:pimeloyl-ACP methyl ester carboxylesterase